jgi:hypothetical protein
MDLTFCGEGSSQQESENRGLLRRLESAITAIEQQVIRNAQVLQRENKKRLELANPWREPKDTFGDKKSVICIAN